MLPCHEVFFDNFIFSFIPWISINFSGFSIYYWKVQCFLEWFDWKITCVGFYKQLNTWDKFLITLNTQKTALPVLLYLCGNNWSLVFTTSAGWVTTDAIMPAKAPQVNVSNELSSGVPSSDGQDTLIKHLFKVWHKAKTVHWQHTCISQNKKLKQWQRSATLEYAALLLFFRVTGGDSATSIQHYKDLQRHFKHFRKWFPLKMGESGKLYGHLHGLLFCLIGWLNTYTLNESMLVN